MIQHPGFGFAMYARVDCGMKAVVRCGEQEVLLQWPYVAAVMDANFQRRMARDVESAVDQIWLRWMAL